MTVACEAKTYPGGPWRAGIMTDERAESENGWPVVVLNDEQRVRGPSGVHVVRVTNGGISRDFVLAARRAGFSIVLPGTTGR